VGLGAQAQVSITMHTSSATGAVQRERLAMWVRTGELLIALPAGAWQILADIKAVTLTGKHDTLHVHLYAWFLRKYKKDVAIAENYLVQFLGSLDHYNQQPDKREYHLVRATATRDTLGRRRCALPSSYPGVQAALRKGVRSYRRPHNKREAALCTGRIEHKRRKRRRVSAA
jgi:hypothetical protein